MFRVLVSQPITVWCVHSILRSSVGVVGLCPFAGKELVDGCLCLLIIIIVILALSFLVCVWFGLGAECVGGISAPPSPGFWDFF